MDPRWFEALPAGPATMARWPAYTPYFLLSQTDNVDMRKVKIRLK